MLFGCKDEQITQVYVTQICVTDNLPFYLLNIPFIAKFLFVCDISSMILLNFAETLEGDAGILLQPSNRKPLL